MPLQQRAPFQEAVAGQLVEAAGGAVPAYAREEVVDQAEGVGGVGALHGVRAGGRRGASHGRHHPLQGRVHRAQQGSQARALTGAELPAVPVPAVDPRVQGVGVTAHHRDRTAVAPGQRRGHRDAEVGQPLGGPVPALDGGRVGGVRVEVVLEEVAAAGGAEPVAPVEQALVDGVAGEGRAGGVAAQEGAQRGRVGHGGWYTRARHAPDARAPRRTGELGVVTESRQWSLSVTRVDISVVTDARPADGPRMRQPGHAGARPRRTVAVPGFFSVFAYKAGLTRRLFP
ncbi:hypothetical protein GCM10020295_40810 [Streptomyces cinereospinus]